MNRRDININLVMTLYKNKFYSNIVISSIAREIVFRPLRNQSATHRHTLRHPHICIIFALTTQDTDQ